MTPSDSFDNTSTELTGSSIGLSLLLAGSLLELHLSEVHDGAGTLVQRALLFGGEAEDTKGLLLIVKRRVVCKENTHNNGL